MAEHPRLRIAVLIVATWVAFAVLQTVVTRALDPRGADEWRDVLRIDVAIALYWAALSAPIGAYHRRLRATRRRRGMLVAAHVPTLLVAGIGAIAVTRLAWRHLGGLTTLAPFTATLTYYADFEIVSYVAVVAVTEMLLTMRALRDRERHDARLESLLARARLDFLEAQLQPHFLFNALGAVSELAYEAPAAAARVIRALISIIRGALSTRSDEVTLGDELVTIEPYLDIQRIRFADWLRIDYDIDGAAVDCLVPRFVLQPLVENAIRHGLTGRTAPGSIEISAAIRNDSLVLRVADNGVGLRVNKTSSGFGIGLTNVRERLAVLYGGRDRLRLTSASGNGTVAEVTIVRRQRSEARPLAAGDRTVPPPEPSEVDRENHLEARSASPRRLAVTSLGIWLICGVLWTQQSFAYLAVRGRLGQTTWQTVARGDMSSALLWAALTPLVFLIARRNPLRRPWLVARVAGYVAGAVVLALAHALLLQRVVNPGGPVWSPVYQGTVIVDLVIVCVLVALAHRRELATWLRDREQASVALSAEVRQARARAARLQSIPPFLVAALERIAEVVRTEPARSEQLLARLADYLRVAIECSDERGVTPEREAALTYCLARFEERQAPALHSHPSA